MKSFLSHALGLVMAIVLILLAVLLAGCSNQDDLAIPVDAKSNLPFPETPEQLMGNFYEAYAHQDLGSYAATLHPDYEFVKTDGETYDRDTELKIAARMFSGEDYVKPHCTIAGISAIEIEQFEGLGEWVAMQSEDREALTRTYRIHICFRRTDSSVITVRGRVLFEVVRDVMNDAGSWRAGWRILRQVDGTGQGTPRGYRNASR